MASWESPPQTTEETTGIYRNIYHNKLLCQKLALLPSRNLKLGSINITHRLQIKTDPQLESKGSNLSSVTLLAGRSWVNCLISLRLLLLIYNIWTTTVPTLQSCYEDKVSHIQKNTQNSVNSSLNGPVVYYSSTSQIFYLPLAMVKISVQAMIALTSTFHVLG